MKKVILIIQREFLAKVKNKSFIVMTFLSPLLMIVIAGLIAYFTASSENKITQIGLVDTTLIFSSENLNTHKIQFENLTPLGFKQAQNVVKRGDYVGLLKISKEKEKYQMQYFSNDNPSIELITAIENQIEKKITQQNLLAQKIDLKLLESAQSDINISLFNFSGKNGVKGFAEIKMFIGGAFGYLIMMFIVIYGNMVMRSVIEEKNSRIVEVIISSVKPFQLMIGKILGTTLAGLLQFLIWVVIGSCGLIILHFTTQSGVSPEQLPVGANLSMPQMSTYAQEILSLPLGLIASLFVVYFIGGYLLYSSFYASIGSAVDNETDSQQFLLPVVAPLVLGVYVGFFTVINDPNGLVAVVFSMIPFTSPIVMLMRVPFGVPWHELVISIIILFTTFMAMVWVASKIYRVGILSYGKKITLREMLKWVKY